MSDRKTAIRARTFRAWFKANLKDSASDIARHGADCGYPWLTYNADGARLFDKYQSDIWEMVSDDARDMGVNVGEFIGSFKRADMLDDIDTFKMLLVWYAAEKVANEIAGE